MISYRLPHETDIQLLSNTSLYYPNNDKDLNSEYISNETRVFDRL